jgi:hypothetical protein
MKLSSLMIVSLTGSLFSLLSSSVWADVETTTFQVNAKVVSFCYIGNKPVQMDTAYYSSGQDSNKAIVISCAMGTPYTVIMEKEVAVNKKVKPETSRSYGFNVQYPRYAYDEIRNLTAALTHPTYTDVVPFVIPAAPPVKAKQAVTPSRVKVTVNF